MSLTDEAREKLEKVQELLNTIAEAETELSELLGEGRAPMEDIAEDAPRRGRKPGSGKGGCSICGKKGHRKTTCPENREERRKSDKPYTKRRPGDGEHLSDESDMLSTGEPLTEEEFDTVKTAQQHDMNAKEIADEINSTVYQVNRAMSNTQYEIYRKKV